MHTSSTPDAHRIPDGTRAEVNITNDWDCNRHRQKRWLSPTDKNTVRKDSVFCAHAAWSRNMESITPDIHTIDPHSTHSDDRSSRIVLWNSLPSNLRRSDLTLQQFRRALKTYLFGWLRLRQHLVSNF